MTIKNKATMSSSNKCQLSLLLILLTFLVACSSEPEQPQTMTEAPQEPTTGILVKNILHDGVQREYVLYVPSSYKSEQEVPLLFNFHGYTSNAGEQMQYGDFRQIADREGFIIAHPEGLELAGNTHWNVGGWTTASRVDDVGFTEELIEEISGNYSIDQNRIYSTGMSNGGYMSFLLACQLSEKITAIASVTGSMTPETFEACNPSHSTPVLQIHGTRDGVVPYNGIAWSKSITNVIDYWTAFNGCSLEEEIISFEDINDSDGSTAEQTSYNCNKNTRTIHVKVTGGGHTWPGAGLNLNDTNYDFNASELIWEFLSQYDLQSLKS